MLNCITFPFWVLWDKYKMRREDKIINLLQNLYFQWRPESFKVTKYSCRSNFYSHTDWNRNSKALLDALFSSAWFLFEETKENSLSVHLWSSLFPVCPYSNTEITPDCTWLWPASSSCALPLLAAFHIQAKKSMYFPDCALSDRHNSLPLTVTFGSHCCSSSCYSGLKVP